MVSAVQIRLPLLLKQILKYLLFYVIIKLELSNIKKVKTRVKEISQ